VDIFLLFGFTGGWVWMWEKFGFVWQFARKKYCKYKRKKRGKSMSLILIKDMDAQRLLKDKIH